MRGLLRRRPPVVSYIRRSVPPCEVTERRLVNGQIVRRRWRYGQLVAQRRWRWLRGARANGSVASAGADGEVRRDLWSVVVVIDCAVTAPSSGLRRTQPPLIVLRQLPWRYRRVVQPGEVVLAVRVIPLAGLFIWTTESIAEHVHLPLNLALEVGDCQPSR